jgi:hypothetical protein
VDLDEKEKFFNVPVSKKNKDILLIYRNNQRLHHKGGSEFFNLSSIIFEAPRANFVG